MRRLLVGIVCLVGILGGCSNQSNTDQTKEINELKKKIEQISLEKDVLEEERKALELAMNQQVNNDYSMVRAKDIEKYPQTLYKQTTVDVDKDGEEEVIELYVNAGKMDDGLFAWDDGQNWLLVVKDDEKTYPLFDEFVQLGSIDFSTTMFDGKPGIVMLKAQHSDRIVQKFTYDKNEKGYQKETFYKKENTNDHYNQPASYAFFEDAFKSIEMAFTVKTLIALEASENTLQDPQERMAIIQPILVDISNAQQLLELVGELNQGLNISLNGAIDLLNQMVNNPPTAEQMNRLQSIYDVFKEIGTGNLIIKEENQVHPEVAEKLQRLDFILNDTDRYEKVREVAWEFIEEQGWNGSAKEGWKNAEVEKVIADNRYKLLDETYEGKEVVSVSFEDKENVVAGTPLLLVDPDFNVVVGYMAGE